MGRVDARLVTGGRVQGRHSIVARVGNREAARRRAHHLVATTVAAVHIAYGKRLLGLLEGTTNIIDADTAAVDLVLLVGEYLEQFSGSAT